MKRILPGWLLGLCLVTLSAALAQPASAQQYPNRPLKLVVPYSAGGGTDQLGRIVAQELGKALGEAVIVENISGAGGSIGTKHVAVAKPDGYTLLMGSLSQTGIGPAITKDLSYDPLNDLTPLYMILTAPNVLLVGESVPARSVKELIALAKSKPGSLNYGSAGVGSFAHVATELFLSRTGTRMTHIPYKGAAEALTGLLSGEIQVLINSVVAAKPNIDAGRIRAIGVTTATASAALPGVPPIAKDVPGYDAPIWNAVFGPPNMPKALVGSLDKALARAVASDGMRAYAESIGGNVGVMSREQFVAFVKEDNEIWKKVAIEAGITPQ